MFLCSERFLLEVFALDYHGSPEEFQGKTELLLPTSPCLIRKQVVRPTEN